MAYWTLNDVSKMILKVEKQQKFEKGSPYQSKDGYTRGNAKPTLQNKVVSKEQDKGEGSTSTE